MVRHGTSHTDDSVYFTAQQPRDDTPDRFHKAPLAPSIVRTNLHGLDRTSNAPLRQKQHPGRVTRAQRLLPAQLHPDRHEVVSSTPRTSHPCSRPVPTTSRWWRGPDAPTPPQG